jgi:hypothetical protein
MMLADVASLISPVARSVPCNGCTRCCHGDTIRIMPHEDARQWQTRQHPYMPKMRALELGADGSCVYLGPTGCTIHGSQPQICREMDCRRIYRGLTFTQARQMPGMLPVWKRGRELVLAEGSKP